MIDPLPELPKPEFGVVRLAAPPEVADGVAGALREAGVLRGLTRYEYRALAETELLEGRGSSGLVAFGRSGLLGRICVDVATGEVVHVPKAESARVTHVNADLQTFTRCVSAVIARFPFYREDEGAERFERVADELRGLIAGVDETALTHDGFWDGLCEDVALGDYADWGRDG
ncbi:SUKH-4 family immunity protein [Actinacidiphila acidipaludis]|uniref:SUKH-4 family immunity protein n=1 Tax=Actinacidiphila acidipaludis TaxID=2873382 RepID=A0ABS7Q335_9ACTN|nr:SUKH-4 family immunity protein [Streptomyces acidipaludis]MBY8876855.1 SUKH-4 family immunity protein [Streptomyces acidipaludis]